MRVEPCLNDGKRTMHSLVPVFLRRTAIMLLKDFNEVGRSQETKLPADFRNFEVGAAQQ